MQPVTQDAVFQSLRGLHFDGIRKDIVALEMVPEVTLDGGRVTVRLEFPSPEHPAAPSFREEVRTAVAAVPGVETVDIRSGWRVRAGQTRHPAVPGVKNVVAVASGKGGVGKSTVAVNLAAALHRLGASVGLMDLDIYGPSVPVALGNDREPQVAENQQLLPAEAHGIRFLSMGQFAREDAPVVWRGPMLHKMVTQLFQAQWGDLDYLVLDLPPGTGDVQLTVTQNVPVNGAVIVTTPQEIALIDARKGLTMFRDAKLPILGLVENLAYYRCRKCSKEHPLFGKDGGAELARAEGVPLLARLPLDPGLAASADAGKPLALTDDGPVGTAFRDLAVETAAVLARRALTPNPFPVLS